MEKRKILGSCVNILITSGCAPVIKFWQTDEQTISRGNEAQSMNHKCSQVLTIRENTIETRAYVLLKKQVKN